MDRVVPIERVSLARILHRGDGRVRLITDIPHAEQGDWDQSHDNSDHHAFQINAVTEVGTPLSHFPRCVEEGIKCFVHGVRHL